MIEVSVSPLVRTIQLFDTDKGESKDRRTRYSCSMLLTDLGLKECRVHFVQGTLTPEINEIVFNTVKDLGYVKAQMEVPEGTPCTRMAEYQYTRDGLDRYIVDL